MFLIKSSFLLFYYRLTTWQPVKITTIITFGVVVINTFLMVFIWLFYCHPVIYWTGDNYLNTQCNAVLYTKSQYACGAINIITDCIIWLIPLPLIWRITVSKRERALAVVTCGVGAVACVACAMRLAAVKALLNAETPNQDEAQYDTWECVEMFLAIICSCIPAIRALVIKKIPGIISARTKESEYSDGKTGSGKDGSFNEKGSSGVAVSNRSVDEEC